MKQAIARILVAGAGAAALLCAGSVAQAADPFKLTSSAFEDNGKLAIKNAGNDKQSPNCVGENVSPPLSWSNPPAGTTSYALIMYDPEGRRGLGGVHWVAYGIPVSVTGFAEGEVSGPSAKYVGGKGARGLAHYSGPCPPPGDWHHYIFTLIATDLDPKALEPGLTRDQLFDKLAGHAKGAAGLIGRFTKP
jgi:Raf kinase inhibitor-like YbhB/YbcL family protein